jgi:TIR domain
MTDVFISYKKEDAGRVIRIVEGLRAEGLTVWWDHGIRAGSEWDKSIHRELYAARAVVAVWSTSSVQAPWVKEEATVGKTRGLLLPVRIDEVEPPLGFMMIQAADLVGWRGDRKDPRWAVFLEAVHAVLHGEAPARLDAPVRAAPKRSRLAMPLAIGGALLAAAALAVLFVPGLVASRNPSTVERAAPPAAEAPVTPVATAPTAAVPPPAPAAAPVAPAPPPAPPPISPGEQQLWDKAVAEKSRLAFQSYLLAYPNGAYAQRARDVLLTCRSEMRETWKPGPDVANQMVRGVAGSSPSAPLTEEQACAKAKSDVRAQAKLMCETITTNGGYRNARWTVGDAPCDCQRPNPRVMTCIADLAYSCRWEMKVAEHVETCG